MDIKYTKKDSKKAKFKISGIKYTTANAIRRAIMTYVPSMAMDKVTVYENTSPFYDEMIAQRIGLVPLSTDLKTYNLRDECKCKGKGCARCEVSFILEKSGPGAVYSGDMKSRDPKIKPVFEKMPILKLREDQKVKMEMVAKLGTMNQHAKYQSCLSSYKQVSEHEFEFFIESYNNFTVDEIIRVATENLESKVALLDAAYLEAIKKKK